MNEPKVIRETISVCPVCLKKVKAKIVEENGKVLLKKSCTLHGNFNDIYWTNAKLYHWAENFSSNNTLISPLKKQIEDRCPNDCGLCPNHASQTVVGVIDVTNRCNLKCPICFASSPNTKGVYEPAKEAIYCMLKFLKNLDGNPPAILFSGGEPLVRNDIVKIVKMAHDLRFMTMLATNGLKISRNPEIVGKLKAAGLNIVYLQFDGTTDSPHEKLRGAKLLHEKLKVIEICREHDVEVILVPTLVKEINDDKIGDIIRFACENVDIVRGVVFQPISFTGRIENLALKKSRICTSRFSEEIEEQTVGKIKKRDMFPVPVMVPPIKVMQNFIVKPWPLFTPSSHCGVWTWVLVSRNGKISFTPVSRFLNIDVFMSNLRAIAAKTEKRGINKIETFVKLLLAILRSMNWRKVHREAGLLTFLKTLIRIHIKPSYTSLGSLRRRLLLVGCMAFMDPYNFDMERARKCVIHYVAPDLRLIPFCVYNIFYRSKIEQMYGTSNQDSITSNQILPQLPE